LTWAVDFPNLRACSGPAAWGALESILAPHQIDSVETDPVETDADPEQIQKN